MAPTPQELRKEQLGKSPSSATTMFSERIVISGMSGLYPSTHNVVELADVLYNKKNPLKTTTRWKDESPELPQWFGDVPNIERFDSQFFKVHYHLASLVDPMSRKLMEQAYQAVFDAGVCPEILSGKKIGVYIGAGVMESEVNGAYNYKYLSGLGLLGCSKSMFANRISYCMNLKGPSMAVDGTGNSSNIALQVACQDLANGTVDAAIVGGAGLCLHPPTLVNYGRALYRGMAPKTLAAFLSGRPDPLSEQNSCQISGCLLPQITPMCMDGKTMSFDVNAHGSARTEAVNTLFLQKAKDAKRIYAEIVGVKNEFLTIKDGSDSQTYGYYRDPDLMSQYIEKFYRELDIPPEFVEYVEACGSADPVADKAELECFEKVFCKQRDAPLLVGSITSNIGYTEGAQGISAITKVLLGYHKGILAGNLHCDNPRNDVAALKDGRMSIVADHKPFNRSYVAVNGLNITGVNSHILLHGSFKPKDLNRYKCDLPRLVTVAARQDEFVTHIIEDLKSRPIDPEEIALFHSIFKIKSNGHLGRGYCILDTNEENETVCLSEAADYFDEMKRPLWFVYSGMGSQWAGMGVKLMRIPIFAAAIERCHSILKPKGIDIIDILTSPDKKTFDNILHSFVGIAAIQIGLTDVLKAVGIEPDMIIGHSVGELGCAYADGCLTADEMILSAYYRGLVSIQSPFIRGSMAAVGMGYEQIKDMLPPEIEVACHNGPDSCTISGPIDIMKQFVAELTERGIFAKEVPCSNIAYHSRYIAEAGPVFRKYLDEVIPNPKPRSERWVSTSIPQSRWDEPLAKYSSAEYHTNNLLNPVLFEETSRLIPANAVLVEVAPHGLLQAILKRSLPESCKNIALTRRGHPDNAFMVLDAIGKLYMEGFTPNLEELYPKVEFPVSTGTPILSHLVKWVHDEEWLVGLCSAAVRKSTSICDLSISIQDDEYKKLQGNVIGGKVLYPFAAALVAVWDTLSMSTNLPKREISVEFRDLNLFTQPIMLKQRPLRIQVIIQKGSGKFEVINENSKVMTGYIVVDDFKKREYPSTEGEDSKYLDLTSRDIYQIFRGKDYNYKDEFQSILRANQSLSEAEIIWDNNWTTFLDGILQLSILKHNYNYLSQPAQIRKISIDVMRHNVLGEVSENKDVRKASFTNLFSTISCGGVTVEDINFKDIPFIEKDTFVLNPSIIPEINYEVIQLVKKQIQPQNKTLKIGKIGEFDSLYWASVVEHARSGIDVKVHFAAINNLDVKKAVGLISRKSVTEDDLTFGMDFSGVTENGERVMGLIPSGSLQNRIKGIPEAMWPVPEYWSLEDAATVPLAYMLAYYTLGLKLELYSSNSSVLVHGGAGALGQAVISVALSMKCEVFTTVSNLRKKQFLMKLFPELKEEHIGNSRDISFRDMVKTAKKGKGVDVIVSCLKGQLKDVALSCGGFSSYFVDLVQVHDNEQYDFGMFHLSDCNNYVMVDIDAVFEPKNYEQLKTLQKIISNGIAAGFVRPLTRVTYAPEEAPRAFRLLAASQHRGRVLIRLDDDADAPTVPRFACLPENTQVIVCTEDSLSVQWADHLISKGARKLLLHCNSVSNYLQFKIRSWSELGVEVKVSWEDLSSVKGAVAFVNEGKHLGKVEGVYIIATNSDLDDLQINKVIMNLDSAVKNLSPTYFGILTSSRNVGEKSCISRIKTGLPATLFDISFKNNITTHSVDKDENIDKHKLHDITLAFEKALLSPYPVLKAEPQTKKRVTLLQEIARIADIYIPDNVGNDVTLRELGLNSERNEMIICFLSNQYQIWPNQEDIGAFTVKQIKELDERLHEPRFDKRKGLATFFSTVSDDELFASTDTVLLSTITHNILEQEDIDLKETYMCIVPGLEGHYVRFQDFCRQLKLPAMVLQPGVDRLRETLSERAQRFTKIMMKKKTQRNNKFYLLGYETGAIVALEMAALLEAQGLTGTVFCIGGTPEEIVAKLEAETSQYNTKELQYEIASHIYSLIAGKNIEADYKKEVTECESWMAPWIRALNGIASHSTQYSRALIEGAYEMLSTARAYVPNPKPLRSRVVLIRASDVGVEVSPQTLMQKYSQQPVEITTLPTPLAHLIKDLRSAAVVNKNLEPETLQSYNRRNICHFFVTTNNKQS